jgi:hypothetical protein
LSSFLSLARFGTIRYTQGALVALVAVGVRAGFKALGEWMVGMTADPAVAQ